MRLALALSISFALLLTITLATSQGQADEESTLEFDLRTVATLTATGAYSDALSLATDLVAENPDSIEAHIAFQDLRLAKGDNKELAREYAGPAKRKGASPDAMYLHARLLTGSKQLNLLKKALRIDPKHFHSLCAAGTYYTGVEKYRDAEKNLLAATQVQRSSATPWNCLGCLEERRGNLEQAEDFYRKAIEADPEHAAAHLNLGSLLISAEEFDEAETVLQSAKRLAPNSPMPLLAQGMLLMARARVPEEDEEDAEGDAGAEGDDAPADQPDGEGEAPADGPPEDDRPDNEVDPETLGEAGDDAAGAEGDDPAADDEEDEPEEDTARSLFEAAVDLKSNTFTSLNMLGLAYTHLREFGLAKKAFSRAIAMSKDNPITYVNLCHMSLEVGQAEQAASWVRQAMRLDSKSAQSYYFAGLCESALGKNRGAESAYLRASKLDDENVLYWRTLGTHYAVLGKWKEAVKVFSKALDLVGDHIELQVDLAFAYSGSGNYGRAADLFEQVVEADPDQITSWMNLGLLYKEKLRKTQRAIECFEAYKEFGGEDKRVDTWLAGLQR